MTLDRILSERRQFEMDQLESTLLQMDAAITAHQTGNINYRPDNATLLYGEIERAALDERSKMQLGVPSGYLTAFHEYRGQIQAAIAQRKLLTGDNKANNAYHPGQNTGYSNSNSAPNYSASFLDLNGRIGVTRKPLFDSLTQDAEGLTFG